VCDRIVVMYAGQIVEEGTVADIIDTPRHPYTVALLDALPQPGRQDPQGPLRSIPGAPPSLIDVPGGCRFAARCPLAVDECKTWDTELLQTGQPVMPPAAGGMTRSGGTRPGTATGR
jgi:oligopeptide/dipeptide ABC transporter ATP-binding protein